MKMKYTAIALLLWSSLYAPKTHAEATPELTQYFQEQLTQITSAVEADNNNTQPAPIEDAWYLRRFWLRVRPKVSFAIPGLFKLEIVPETEFLFQRDLPQDWGTYKPNL